MDFYQSYGTLSYLRSYSDPTYSIGISKDSLLRLHNSNLVQNTISNKKRNYICKKSNSSKYNKRDNCSKMAPISEKHSPTIKENAKENISVTTTGKNPSQNGRGIGPEILDFRESWLQDVETYKDHIKSPPTLLTTHNHLHTVDGCLTSVANKPTESSKRRARTKSDSESDARLKNFHEPEDGHQHKNLNHIISNGQANDIGNLASLTKNIIVNPYHLSLLNTQESDKSKIVINSIKNNNIILQNTQNCSGKTENNENLAASNNVLVNIPSLKSKSIHINGKSTSYIDNNKNKNIDKESVKRPTINGEVIRSVASTHTSQNNISTSVQTGNCGRNTSVAKTDFANQQEKKNIKNKTIPSFNADVQVNTLENVDDDDNDSYYDDDEFLGVIDTAEDVDSTDDSDDEYIGCTYYLNPEEEQFNKLLESKSPIKLFEKRNNSAESINTLLNAKDKIESECVVKTENNVINSSADATLHLSESSPHIPTPSEYYTPNSILTPSLFPLVPPYLTFSSHIEKGPPVLPELQRVLKWRFSIVMPKVVRRVVANSGFRLIKKTNDWMASWEKHMKSPCFKAIKSHQKYNHLPGTFKIGRKDSVWRNIKHFITKFGKKEFGFMQKSFVLPQDLEALKKSWPKHAKKGTKWIIKPPASARGSGIKVVSRWTDFPKQKPLIVQKYIERPLLINGNKFDLRLYIIITSINPLRVFMHTDGLARFASVQYRDDIHSLKDRCMHLTNYSINKFSTHYAKNEDHNACQGHKWTLKSLWNYFLERGINTTKLWGALRNLVIKTVIGGEGCLNRMFKANVNSRYNCYELFGFDVLLDENLIPWLLEVNISPSLHSDLPLDQHVKGPLIQAVLNSVLYQVPPKLSQQHEKLIKAEYNINGPLCYDLRIFTTCLSQDEVRKHNQYTNREIEYRDEYLDTILDDLTPDDVRCLIITEDELARSKPLERIFPSENSYEFLKYLEGPRYYNRLLDAWVTKFSGDKKKQGLQLLIDLCKKGYHLQVPDTALKKEPSTDVDVFELNVLYKAQIKNSIKTSSPTTVSESNEKKDELTTADIVFKEEAKLINNEHINGSVSIENV
ncbi:tubulin monoglutamylase TTLL4-like isoform X2 [Condylostylus longicornis]|uniref:tubulin monoglutamylase TTLL4-like isoform X2 n=1 Tax=Condylostylus longicornis TaxID=2530218 RepID=UPI00244E246E|nr:tubulin monoglutamylase TTLL4-like isoform X2 [Condylostylus longicornis]